MLAEGYLSLLQGASLVQHALSGESNFHPDAKQQARLLFVRAQVAEANGDVGEALQLFKSCMSFLEDPLQGKSVRTPYGVTVCLTGLSEHVKRLEASMRQVRGELACTGEC